MTHWTRINAQMDHWFGDPLTDTGRSYGEALRIEAWNWAQDVFCAHTPRQRQVIAEIDAGQRNIILPDDFLAIEGLYDAEEEQWWWPMRNRPGGIRYPDDDALEFWLWDNRMYLEAEISYDTGRLTMLYWAYWPDVEYTENASGQITVIQPHIYTPKWAQLALMHLALSSCMIPGEVEAADLRNWGIKVESGDPLDNPRMQSARWHLEIYERLLEKFPPARRTEVTV